MPKVTTPTTSTSTHTKIEKAERSYQIFNASCQNAEVFLRTVSYHWNMQYSSGNEAFVILVYWVIMPLRILHPAQSEMTLQTKTLHKTQHQQPTMAVLHSNNHHHHTPTCSSSNNNNDQYNHLSMYTSNLISSSGKVKRQNSMDDSSSVLHHNPQQHSWPKSRSSTLIRGGILSFLIVTTIGAVLKSRCTMYQQQETRAAKSLAEGPVVSVEAAIEDKKGSLRSLPILEPVDQQLVTGRNQDKNPKSTDSVSSIIRHAAAVVPESGGTESVPVQANKNDASSTSAGRIPNVLLAGTQKASTTSLAIYLMNLGNPMNDTTTGDSPSIGTCFSDPEQDVYGAHGKEPHFFDDATKFERGLEFYQSIFQHCPNDAQLLIDGTPETMLHPHRVKAIYDAQGTADQVKIIFILREPVSREISWYNHQLRYVNQPDRPEWTNPIVDEQDGHIRSFIEAQRANVINNFEHKANEYIYGYYAHWLRQWNDLFDRKKQILILSYDELKYNPKRLLQRVHTFLQIPMPTNKASMVLPRENANTKKTPSPPCEDQLELAEYFRGPNEELYQFLKENPGPSNIEQIPFPKFTMKCRRNITSSSNSSDIQ